MLKTKFTTVDQYLATVPPVHRALLKKLRSLIREAAPAAVELISYNMPAYKYKGVLVYFASFAKHCSLFPAGGKVFTTFEKELKGYKTSKGTIQFTAEKPLPDALVKKIVKLRVKQNEERQQIKKQEKVQNNFSN